MINKKTKVIIYSVDQEEYRIAPLQACGSGEFPVCTLGHFFRTVLQLSEELFGTVKENPFWQEDIDWNQIIYSEEVEA